ncbi:MAG: transcriptional initiation protein Tat [Armatimonadia bacterium]|nr:transcriptional initiation protein Tat [Armatimonadia bacterium]
MTGQGGGWEELPYWLKGLGDLGYVLGDERIIAEARKWLDAILGHQKGDGWFGPEPNREANDIWPNMVVLFAMQSLHEATGEERALRFIERYLRWMHSRDPETLLPESWQKLRGGDNLETVYWLYNRTGESWLLDLAATIHRRTSAWEFERPTPHGVNIAQGCREPATWGQQSGDRSHLEATERLYSEVMAKWGQVPGGMFASDENSREGYEGPELAAETCTMVEYMYSFESLLRITGDAKWAERCEDVALNSLPAAAMPDWRGLHYLTAPNLVQCDDGPSHEFQNQGETVSYSPHLYRCCQHNVAQGWPYYAEHLWMATRGGGLAAVLYAPCQVTATVGDGQRVTIEEVTDYPFGESVEMKVSTDGPVRFPLTLRLPDWCRQPELAINGEAVEFEVLPGGWLTVEREWTDGDTAVLSLPMEIAAKRWPTHGDAVSIRRGPLWFSLLIGEEWRRSGGTDDWPEFEVFPTDAWNYGLSCTHGPTFDADVQPLSTDEPFTAEGTPIRLRARGRRIPQWKMLNHTCGPLGPSPVHTDEPEEELTLIPMGCARLRVSVFPVAVHTGGHMWPDEPERTLPPGLRFAPRQDVDGLINLVVDDGVGVLAGSSYRNAEGPPDRAVDWVVGHHQQPSNRWTCRLSTNPKDHLEVILDRPRKLRAVGVELFDNGVDEVPPKAWRVLYRSGDAYVPVPNSQYALDAPTGGTENRIDFDETEVDRLRIELTHADVAGGKWSAISEVYLWGEEK